MMTKQTTLAAVGSLIAMLVVIVPAGLATSNTRAELLGGTSSKEELIRRFVDAISTNDGHRLRTLQVDENEYADIILPGAVPEGQPMRKWPEDVRRYFAREFIQKSQMVGANLIDTYKGHRYEIASMAFEGGTKRYANHFVYVQLRLQLKDETGTERALATGSIVEIGGQYKFMSYLPD
jgi:hypothetical protein